MPRCSLFWQAVVEILVNFQVESAMPQIDKFLLAQALALGLDAPDEIRIIYRQGTERRYVKYDGLKIDSELSPMAEEIIGVIEQLDKGESLIGKEIASRAGYPFNSRLRTCLTELVDAKKIGKAENGGYCRNS